MADQEPQIPGQTDLAALAAASVKGPAAPATESWTRGFLRTWLVPHSYAFVGFGIVVIVLGSIAGAIVMHLYNKSQTPDPVIIQPTPDGTNIGSEAEFIVRYNACLKAACKCTKEAIQSCAK